MAVLTTDANGHSTVQCRGIDGHGVRVGNVDFTEQRDGLAHDSRHEGDGVRAGCQSRIGEQLPERAWAAVVRAW